ncbi:unnamed protein product [Boreogadus saida]
MSCVFGSSTPNRINVSVLFDLLKGGDGELQQPPHSRSVPTISVSVSSMNLYSTTSIGVMDSVYPRFAVAKDTLSNCRDTGCCSICCPINNN